MSTNLFDDLHADDETLARLHRRLERDATTGDLLDVAYRTVDSPVGTLLLAATTVGLVRVAYEVEDHDAVLATLPSAVSPRVLRAPARLDARRPPARRVFRRAAHRVRGAGRSTARRRVPAQRHRASARHRLRPPRKLRRVAAAVGNPRAVRAVGTACAHNPLPVVIPCHRVVRSDGSTGQYVGGRCGQVGAARPSKRGRE